MNLPILEDVEYRPAASRPGTAAGSRSVYIETYGCQMNVADSELVASILNESGYQITTAAEEADIILLNTCAVREHAEERVIGRISQLNGLRAHRPNLTLGVLGCMAQHLSKSLPVRAPFVDLVMGPDAYRRLPEILAQSSDDALFDVRLDRAENYIGVDPVRRTGTNAWVTIIRGCDKFCTFCIVPYVRGRERSVSPGQIVDQVKRIAQEGFKEVTLLGQTVNSYREGDTDFADLLREVSAIDGIERVRFTSPYPVDFTDRVIAAMAEVNEVCPSLHLPVQSGSNKQLDTMQRGYTIEEYRELIRKLRIAIPDIALTTDIITGFCGESDEDFRLTYELMEEIRYDSAFMFKYSAREGTYAHKKMNDNIPEEIKGQRLQQVIKLQESISREVNQQYIGQTVEVLVEGPSKRPAKDGQPRFYGRTRQGKTAILTQEIQANEIVNIRVTDTTSHTLLGEIAE
ncbi:MAG TPA: tRNA (N6-isopentenyl adenosine(37)-C2)-methylthiotransferase MiaB [Candidatus Latescibacteria bacterium]|nr:tRNA (N6-isopentenyl adenosine(37)-C2)-methylthiotransferase MiaB [Candidatus Latescibacterota bacterium]